MVPLDSHSQLSSSSSSANSSTVRRSSSRSPPRSVDGSSPAAEVTDGNAPAAASFGAIGHSGVRGGGGGSGGGGSGGGGSGGGGSGGSSRLVEPSGDDPFADCEVNTDSSAPDRVCEVEKLLLEVGIKIGRKESELRPYIDKIVKENWLETYDALENLKDDEWRELGLPKRLHMVLREAVNLRSTQVPASRKHSTTTTTTTTDKCTDTASTTTDLTALSIMPPHETQRTALTVPVPVQVASLSSPALPTVTSPVEKIEQSQSLNDFHFDEVACGDGYELFDEFIEGPCELSPKESATPKTAAERRKEVESFIIEVGEDLGRTADDMADVIDKIITHNWIDSMDRLTELTEDSWQKLHLPVFFVETARQKIHLHLNPTTGNGTDHDDERTSDEGLTLTEWEKQLAAASGTKKVKLLFLQIGVEFGRSDDEMSALADKVIQKFNIQSVDELNLIPPTSYAELGLPLRLQTSLRTRVLNHSHVQMYGREGSPSGASTTAPNGTARPRPPLKYYSYPECPLPNKEIPVEEFLERVGKNINKVDEHMAPFITRIVQDHWYDSVAALRKLTDSEWKELLLPRRLLDEIRVSLSDPEALDLSTVFANNPDPAYFVCDVDLAVRRIEKEIPNNIRGDTVRSLVKLMETILSRPHDRMKRRIRKANPNFHKRAGRHPSAILLLQSVGYQDVGDYWILSVAYETRLTEAHEALTKLAMTEYKKGTRPRRFGL